MKFKLITEPVAKVDERGYGSHSPIEEAVNSFLRENPGARVEHAICALTLATRDMHVGIFYTERPPENVVG